MNQSKIWKVRQKCILNGIAEVVVSGIVIDDKMSDSFVGDVNKNIAMMCKKNLIVYMDNVNIPTLF